MKITKKICRLKKLPKFIIIYKHTNNIRKESKYQNKLQKKSGKFPARTVKKNYLRRNISKKK